MKATASAERLAWRERLAVTLQDSRAQFDASLRPATTLRIGGPADCLVDIESERDVDALFQCIEEQQLPFIVLGKGSNLLVSDAGFRGVAIRLGKHFRSFATTDVPGRVRAGAGLADSTFVERARELGLGGMEFLVAIPGSIGGAIAMNAGAHHGETAQFLTAVRYFDRKAGIREVPASTFAFSYRHAPLRGQDGCLVLAGEFQLQPVSDAEIQRRKAEIQTWRREHQPRDFPNCGSVFKNPPGTAAAKLIDEAGLKGTRRGDAQVSEVHANFIVNRGNATAADVLALVDFIRETIYKRTSVSLELEMQVL